MEVRKTALLYGGDVELTFVEDKSVWPEVHEYQVRFKTAKGWSEAKKVDLSVSGITKVMDKPALVGWATKMCAEYVQLNYTRLSEKVVVQTLTGLAVDEVELGSFIQDMKGHGKGKKKEAATIGVMAHAWIEAHIKHILGLGQKPEPVVNAAVNNAIKAYLAWEEANHVVYLATERLVYSRKLGYAGTLDTEAKVNGELSIIDNKTNSGIYPEMEYQTAGYQMACEEESFYVKRPIAYDARWILRLDKVTGEFEARRYTDHLVAKEGFLACRTLAKLNLARSKAKNDRKVEQRAIRATTKATASHRAKKKVTKTK